MKRKILLVTLTLVTLFACTFGLSACGGKEHTHTYAESWTYDEIYHWHASTCEHTDKVSEKSEHNFVDGICSVCGYEQGTQPHEHTFSESWTSDDGYHWHAATCEHADVISGKAAHNFKNGVCTICGYDNGTGGENPTHTHTYNQQVTTDTYLKSVATCVQKTEYYYSCTCGEKGTETFEYGELAAHISVSTDNAVEATCTTAGKESDTVCSVCGETLSTGKVVPATGHTEVVDKAVAPGCTKTGLTEGKHCSICGETLLTSKEIPATGHTEVSANNAVTPICTAAGKESDTVCSVCGKTLSTGTKIPATGHNYENGVCTICGEIEKTPSKGLKYTLSGTHYIVSGIGTCKDTDIVIPATYNNLPVTSIGSNAFYNRTSLTSVTIGDSVISIGSSAFYGCTSLTCVNIPYGVTSIGESAFSSCTSLNAVYITDIVAWCGIAFGSNPLSYAHNLYLNGELVTDLVIPDGVTSIGSRAFKDCTSLTSVTIGNGVTEIGEDAFYHCTSLTSVTIGNGVTEIGEYAFFDCTSLTNIMIPDSVTSIGNWAFCDCTSLTSIVIPDSVTSIGNWAFCDCTSLTSVTIGKGVTSIGYQAFEYCTALTEINYNATECADLSSSSSVFYQAGQSSEGITVTIGANVKKIPSYLFYAYLSHVSSNSSSSPKIVSVVYAENSQHTSIGDYAFRNCPSLTSITIGNGVPTIGVGAFLDCTSLTSVTIGKGVTSIGNYAFQNCIALTEINYNATECADLSDDNYVFYKAGQSSEGITVTIGANVTKIPAYLFDPYNSDYPPKIVSVVFAKNSQCTSIGNYTFAYCTSLTSIVIPNGVTLIGYQAFAHCWSLTSVTIGSGVTSIGGEAFYWCTSLESITVFAGNKVYRSTGNSLIEIASKTLILGCKNSVIPSDGSVTSIGSFAFFFCTSLTSINIPDSITEIGSKAFWYCTSLTSIVIPNGVTSIGDFAFNGCTSLISVTIGNSVTEIGYGAFSNCISLTSITVDGNNSNYKSIDGNLYSKDGTTLIQYAIGKTDASFTIPNSVTSIGDYAFYNCTALTEINYNATECADLSDKNYVFSNAGQSGEGITVTIGANVKKIPAYLFCPYPYVYGSYSPKIVSVVFAENSQCTSIGKYAFALCTSLTSINIPDSVTSIGESAFSGCTSLTNVTIGNGVTSIGEYAFNNCTSLKYNGYDNAYYLGNNSNLYVVLVKAKSTDITRCTINEKTKVIYNSAFSGCTSLTSINIPDSVTEIGDDAFYNCTSLTSVTIGNGVTSIDDDAFYKCTSLKYNEYDNAYYLGNKTNPYVVLVKAKSTDITSCTINEKTKVIYSSAFYKCTSLTSIVIPDGVTSIGEYAFEYCTSLTSIVIPDSVITIGSGAFEYCTSLTSIVIPDSVTSIGNYAFWYCTSLTSIVIPNGVTSIGYRAFLGCTSLTSVTIGNGVTSIGYEAFYKCTSLTSIKVDGNNSNYKSIDGNLYSKDGATLIQYAIGKTNASFTIPNGVTSIGDYAFAYCTSLTSIVIPDSVPSIGERAFSGCTSLTSIVIPDSVTSIGSYAFDGCTSLTSIVIPDSVTAIGNSAFSSCYKLIEVYNLSSLNITAGSSDNGRVAYYAKNVYTAHNGASKLTTTNDGYVFYDDTADGNGYYLMGYTGTATSLTLPDKYNGSNYSIYRYAFYGCASLTSVTIGNGVTSIGNYAFYNCTALTEINYNATECADLSGGYNNSNYVFAYAGQSGEGITVTIGANVKKIPAYLFYPYYNDSSYSPKIVSVVFAENSQCTIIGSSAFYECTSLTGVYITDIAAWCGITFGSNPLSYAHNLYLNGELVTDLVIPNSVTSIGSSAFSGCTSLTSITIPDSVTEIGSGAFSGCTSLTSVTIGDSVISIGNSAFYNCSSLTSVTIGSGVTSIGERAFYNCTALTEINYNATECADLSFYNNYVFYNAGQSGEGITVTIGANVKKIPAYLFHIYNSSSNSSPKIVSVVFAGDSQCTSIESCAFGSCTSLASIVIPDSVTSIGVDAFSSCTSLTSVTIGNGVTSIGEGAFLWCFSLTSITIGNGVTSIGEGAFYWCTSLTRVYIEDIAAWCGIEFGNDSSNPLSYADNLYLNGKLVTDLVIPDGVTSIGSYAFYSCTSLKSVTIGSGVSEIGYQAFYNCTSLTSVTFQNTSGWWRSSSSTATSGTSISSTDLADPATAATYLTSTYYNYYWKRS